MISLEKVMSSMKTYVNFILKVVSVNENEQGLEV